MKIAFYSPYLDTAGGGEKYILTAAEILSKKYQVEVLLDNNLYSLGEEEIKKKINSLHDIDFSKIQFIKAPIGKGSSFFKRLAFLKKYDYLFYLTDGSIFYSTAKNSFLHFQVPFENKNFDTWNKLKLSTWKLAICNSIFTKRYINKNWPIKTLVIYPPVSVDLFKPLTKIKQIISVGRFFGFLKDKKHQVLINAFKQLVDKNKINDWSLVLVGGAGEGDKEYIAQLKEQSQGYNITISPNVSLKNLSKLYGQSSIYWHGAGFGENDPSKMEHFGISTVEAMTAGCVPVVINLGGQKEIVENNLSGLLWDNLNELQEKTIRLINNQDLIKKMGKESQKRAKLFSKTKFEEHILKLIRI